jgi:Zn ribbon nucleic-acid-binding protein
MEFNNGRMLVCPRCQSEDILSIWDEQDAFDREDEEEPEDEDDE